jgi:Tfp pilus assembly protein PilE
MADKGYGRYIVEKNVVAEISKLKDEAQQLERYFSLASTTQPIGQRTKE